MRGAAPLTGLLLESAKTIEATKSRLMIKVGIPGLHDPSTTSPEKTNRFSVSQEPLPSLGLPFLCTLKPLLAQLWQKDGRGRGQWGTERRGWKGRWRRDRGVELIYSTTPKISPTCLIFLDKLSSFSLPFLY